MKNPSVLKTISSIPLKSIKNQRVLLRADFNVPIGDDRVIDDSEDWRIKAVLPTIKYLLKRKAKIILLAHLGRPAGKVQESLRLEPIQDRLSELLGLSVKKMSDCVGRKVENAIKEMDAGDILLLENLRFYAEEEQNDSEFSKKLARFGDIYVNDAFSDCHRAHASIVGITKYLPSYAGLLLEKEFQLMKNAIKPKHPAVAIIGGAKIETKLSAVQNLAKIYDHVLVGGMIANQIIKPEFLNSLASNIILPAKESLIKKKYFDIGQDTVKELSIFLKNVKTIVWNGPIGKFEDPKYQEGTKGIIKLIESALKKDANVLIGGGETIYAVQKFAPEMMTKKIKGFNVSTGGGAMLEFLSGKKLPGIEALKK